MKTMFDVNDEITFSTTGRIMEYFVKTVGRNNCEDCYTVNVPCKGGITRIYLSSKDLEAMNAKKVET